MTNTEYFWMKFSNCDLKIAAEFLEKLLSGYYEKKFRQYIIYQEDEYFYACFTYSTTPMSLWKYIVRYCIYSFQKPLIHLRFHMPEKIQRIISKINRSDPRF